MRIERFRTIGRAIELSLSEPALIKVYDITGRLVHKQTADAMDFVPTSAGVYQIMAEGAVKRVVIAK